MKNKSTDTNNGWNLFLTLLFIIGLTYVIDWSFLKGGITAYPISCPDNYTEGNGCFELRKTTYYPDKNKQIVKSKDDFGIKTLQKCTVIDRKNWECMYNDESATFGFNSGKFHSLTLKTSLSRSLSDKWDSQTHYVSRWSWLLESWNIR